MTYTRVLALLLCFLLSDVTYAFRCGNALVEVGDHINSVLKKCGDPESIERHFEFRTVQNSANAGIRFPQNVLSFGQQSYTQIEISVEEWIYNLGRLRFQQFLRFENGVLTNIEVLDRGN